MTSEAQASERGPRKRFALLRSFALADFITLGNAACGTLAIFMCLKALDEAKPSLLWIAFGLLPVALALDFLDGFIARWRRKASILGADLDSLADIVSFGVAPAVLGYTLGLRGGWDVVLLVVFVVCGISRLARYNATVEEMADHSGKVRFYEGLPIPSSLIVVAVLAVAFGRGQVFDELWLGCHRLLGMQIHPLSLLYLFSGCAMASSTLRIPKP